MDGVVFARREHHCPSVVTTVNVVNRSVPFTMPAFVLLAFPSDGDIQTMIVGIAALIAVTVVNGVC